MFSATDLTELVLRIFVISFSCSMICVSLLYTSSRQIPSRSPSIESISSVDSPGPVSPKARSQSQPSPRPSLSSSSRSSSVRSAPEHVEEKPFDSILSANTNTHETIDTAPFDIQPPPVVQEVIARKKSSAALSRRGRSASAHEPRRNSSAKSLRKAPSEIYLTEEKSIADE